MDSGKVLVGWFTHMITEKISIALMRFYEHNDPLIFLVPIILVSLLSLILHPRRRAVFLLLGSLLLLLEFEYTKNIFKEIKSDWINQIFSADFQFRKYQFSAFFFQEVVPFAMSATGWFFLSLAALL